MKINKQLTGGFFTLLLLAAGCGQPSSQQKNDMESTMKWEKLPDLPGTADTASLGVSAPFTGIHEGKLVVAGGCNFPDKPVTEGGTKRYYDEIFLLDLSAPTAWTAAGHLPYPVAYGASVSTPEGVVCIGGNNSDSSLVRVSRIAWNAQAGQVEAILLPSLPAPLDNLAAAYNEGKIYVVAGNENGQPSHAFLVLDLSKTEEGWRALPAYPGAARIQPVLSAQQSPQGKRIYLAGGFQPIQGNEPPVVSTNLLAFDPATNQWNEEAQFPTFEDGSYRSLTGGCSVAYGDSCLLFMSGVNYDLFLAAIDRPRQLELAKQTGNTALADSLQAEGKAYMHHPVEWYKFNTSLLCYNTFTKQWSNLGEYEQLARAGAGTVNIGNELILINGELKPGIRTPQVNRFTIVP